MKTARLIRYGNLLLIAFAFCTFRYGFLELQAGLPLALNNLQFLLLTISAVCIGAGGFLINNIIDNDVEKKYGISEGIAYNLYIGLNIIGVGIGFYISNYIGTPGYTLVFILLSGTMYLYATSLKYTIVINNIIVACIVAVSVVLIGVFNLYPSITPENKPYMATIFSIFLDYAAFAFIISFIREIIKNLRDTDKDYNNGINTLPIALGKNRIAKITVALNLIPVAMILYYIDAYFVNESGMLLYALLYVLLFVLGPLIYFIIKLWSAKTYKDFDRLSLTLKIVLAFAALSIVIITFNIQNNA
ncbi:geranylgeranylglycerol-phosphate geranylgeranyltransferase [Flavobacterium beibuense]|uniref:geranylgeranylglycerol-phosphate geranylgeranyltransferase n=1 Tax=Flavobacterium beibuense TaxID=657326 RepID=UPI000690C40A|nr:geranylgeranylglycerol-phosphate geranylgeranyltransferase [Flavobacterium beibuense]